LVLAAGRWLGSVDERERLPAAVAGVIAVRVQTVAQTRSEAREQA